MSTPRIDPSKVLFSTEFQYFLNYSTTSALLSVPGVLHGVGTTTNYSVSIPIQRTKDFTQLRVRFSFDSSKWYNFPMGDVVLDINFGSISTVATYSANSITFTFYVVNQMPFPATNPAFTVTIQGLLFVTPE